MKQLAIIEDVIVQSNKIQPIIGKKRFFTLLYTTYTVILFIFKYKISYLCI